MTLVRLEPAVPQSRVKHSTSEPLCSLKLNRIEYELHLALQRASSNFNSVFAIYTQFFFAHPINPKGLSVFYFQGLIHIFKDNFTKFQDKRHFFQIS